MARFYLDEDVNEKVAPRLAARGHDVKTTTEAGNKNASDPDQLKFATSENRIIITNNRADFEDHVAAKHPDLSNTCVRVQKERYVFLDKSGGRTEQTYTDRQAGRDNPRDRAAAKWAARAPPDQQDATPAADTPERGDEAPRNEK
jgi:hypothetical protein